MGSVTILVCNNAINNNSTCSRHRQVYKLKARLNGSNMLVKHHPTLLDATCSFRLNTMMEHVRLCWMMLDEVWFCSNFSSNIVQHFSWHMRRYSFPSMHCATRSRPGHATLVFAHACQEFITCTDNVGFVWTLLIQHHPTNSNMLHPTMFDDVGPV